MITQSKREMLLQLLRNGTEYLAVGVWQRQELFVTSSNLMLLRDYIILACARAEGQKIQGISDETHNKIKSLSDSEVSPKVRSHTFRYSRTNLQHLVFSKMSEGVERRAQL
jgi:hypothetical protein